MNLKDDASPVGVSVTGAKDSRGKTARIEKILSCESGDSNLVEVTGDAASGFKVGPGALDGVDANADGLIGDPVAITVKADADLGDGVKEVTGVGLVQVIAGDATVLEVGFEAPTA